MIYGGNVYWEIGGYVAVRSDATGAFVTNYDVGLAAQEIVVGDILYVGTAAFDMPTGAVLWSGLPPDTRSISG